MTLSIISDTSVFVTKFGPILEIDTLKSLRCVSKAWNALVDSLLNPQLALAVLYRTSSSFKITHVSNADSSELCLNIFVKLDKEDLSTNIIRPLPKTPFSWAKLIEQLAPLLGEKISHTYSPAFYEEAFSRGQNEIKSFWKGSGKPFPLWTFYKLASFDLSHSFKIARNASNELEAKEIMRDATNVHADYTPQNFISIIQVAFEKTERNYRPLIYASLKSLLDKGVFNEAINKLKNSDFDTLSQLINDQILVDDQRSELVENKDHATARDVHLALIRTVDKLRKYPDP